MIASSYLNRIASLEAQNDHSEAALTWAKMMDELSTNSLAPAYITILTEIRDRHIVYGSIQPNDRDMRDSIVRDIRELLKLAAII